MKFKLTATDVTYQIEKELGVPRWGDYGQATIDIGSIEELVAFIDKWGRVIIDVYDVPIIEIYNDWRE